eukprot:6463313-Prymnesium_polylepis.1
MAIACGVSKILKAGICSRDRRPPFVLFVARIGGSGEQRRARSRRVALLAGAWHVSPYGTTRNYLYYRYAGRSVPHQDRPTRNP